MIDQLQENISNMFFVLEDTILGDDVHAVILMLLEEFASIPKPKNGLELSQFYSLDSDASLMSQIVLKYSPTSISSDAISSCIKFFVKRTKEKNTYTYTRLHSIYVHFESNFEKVTGDYVRSENLDTIEKTMDVVIGDIQTSTMKTSTLAGSLQIYSRDKIPAALEAIRDIVSKTQDLAVKTLEKTINRRECTAIIPSKLSLSLATRFANRVTASQDKTLSIVLIPDRSIEIFDKVVYQPDATICVTTPTSLSDFKIYRTSRGDKNSLYSLAKHIDAKTRLSDNTHIVIVSDNLSILLNTNELSDLEKVSKAHILPDNDVDTLTKSMSISNTSVSVRIQNHICRMLGQTILEFKPS